MTTVTTYPSVTKSPYCPELKEYGIELNHYKSPSDGENLIVYGTFLLPKNLDIKSYSDPYKSVVLTVNSYGRYIVVSPYLEVVIFPGDYQENAQYIAGYFQLNISSYIDTSISNKYYIVCSLGKYISNILMVTV